MKRQSLGRRLWQLIEQLAYDSLALARDGCLQRGLF